MPKGENHNLLESMKEAIIKDPHLYDRVLKIIRDIRTSTGQSLGDYMRTKETAEKDILEQRKRQSAVTDQK